MNHVCQMRGEPSGTPTPTEWFNSSFPNEVRGVEDADPHLLYQSFQECRCVLGEGECRFPCYHSVSAKL